MLAALLWWTFNNMLDGMKPWIERPPYAHKSLAVIMMVIVCTMAMMTLGVLLWALVFQAMHVFGSLEEALFFALVAYTTLGLGDVQIPDDRRLLGGITGANGFLMFGLMTAMLTDTLRHVRRVQHHLED
ncbi:MAG: two pore domain potassium channel family protein [Devosiaceae bacterium]|nr:two pore domain potassium channel family protein [Devosiaceae bacterium MH13]